MSLIISANATSFDYSFFDSNSKNLIFQGNSSVTDGFVQLTTNRRDALLNNSVGRILYAEPVHLWDSRTGKVADFTTRFSFNIKMLFPPDGADGMAFFIVPNGSQIPPNSEGSTLGVFAEKTKFNSTQSPVVAVEFDTFPNSFDPRTDHVGIDINSIISVATWNRTLKYANETRGNVWIGYNSSTKILGVYLSFDPNPVFDGNYVLTYVVDLKTVLPEWIDVGLSAATGSSFEVHNIYSWEFNSTEFPSNSSDRGSQTPKDPATGNGVVIDGKKKKNSIGLVIGIVVGGTFVVGGLGLGLIYLVWWKKRNSAVEKEEEEDIFDASEDDDYVRGTGPRRFTYIELDRATNHFATDGKLGEGGFGGVYRGFISDSNLDVAVKRVSSGSKQGKKEFVSEVRIISRLRHKNLVRLIGWCHERSEFLLVYELMPNGSLDSHIFGKKAGLTWALRYKIALGLASALLYLHEEWEQCIVHRDIKSSNVMLDSAFNVKLGDFGLARLVDHEMAVKTTMIAGTMGYLAPECFTSGKAGKESDVYSFGVVALEIACGRRPVEPSEEEGKVGLVAWVSELYANGRLFEAVDARLNMDFDELQLERLMVVGLWCSNLDHNLRPSIRQAISVLNFDSALPDLTSRMSMPTYFMPSKHAFDISQASSSTTTDSLINPSYASIGSYTTTSSSSNTSTKYSASASLLRS
ncbi:hypothetical protein Syun_004347 [Stephania yunnanensis]|uniref:non-specific serine/threonine protein kinase n=1 Tax=Stephania yunnanensis TaxID=152371 RepID=A0AAP0L3T6_9MAGN